MVDEVHGGIALVLAVTVCVDSFAYEGAGTGDDGSSGGGVGEGP